MPSISHNTRAEIAEKATPIANKAAREELLGGVNPAIRGVLDKEWTPYREYSLVKEAGLQLEPDKNILTQQLMATDEGYDALHAIAHDSMLEALSDEEVMTSLLKDAFSSDRTT